ncbi:MAG: FtsX-like permease family protein [Lentisphaeria bacterium]|nr:FtsX-like permease family protein [Lentisphaeria bacterium]
MIKSRKRWIFKQSIKELQLRGKQFWAFFLASSCGMAAILSILVLRDSISKGIENHAKQFLGADLKIQSRIPFDSETKRIVQDSPYKTSRETRIFSMIILPGQASVRLAQIRGIEGEFPFYGDLKLTPDSQPEFWLKPGYVFVDSTLQAELDLTVGQKVNLGFKAYQIAGFIEEIPGDTQLFSQLAPRVFISLKTLQNTGLLSFGSRSFHYFYIKKDQTDTETELKQYFQPLYDRESLRIQDPQYAFNRLEKSLNRFTTFLSLVATAAFILGNLGMISTIKMYLDERLNEGALLRCMGFRKLEVFCFYGLQILYMNIISLILAIVFCFGVVAFSWQVISQLLPYSLPLQVSVNTVGIGIVLVAWGSLLFYAWSLLPLTDLNPYPNADKKILELTPVAKIGRIILFLMMILSLGIFVQFSLNNLKQAFILTAGYLAILAFLFGIASAIVAFIRKTMPKQFPFFMRQGLKGIFRPGNQSTLLIMCIGTGIFFLVTINLLKFQIIEQLNASRPDKIANLMAFDIQDHQKEKLLEKYASQDVSVMDVVPVIGMRIIKLKGVDVSVIRKNPSVYHKPVPAWTLNREYKSTYRRDMKKSEKLLEGNWVSEFYDKNGTIPVSLEKRIAERLGLNLGDTFVVDIQGIELGCSVSSIREVNWLGFESNFFLVFPAGLMEDAPASWIVSAHAGNRKKTAALQKSVTMSFPNISIIDVRSALAAVDAVAEKLLTAIRFMAGFLIVTVFGVLFSSMITGRRHRLQELNLLRVLGTREKLLGLIMGMEFLALGIIASISGIGIALFVSWAITKWIFKLQFIIQWSSILWGVPAVCLPILVIGFLTSYRYKQSQSQVI